MAYSRNGKRMSGKRMTLAVGAAALWGLTAPNSGVGEASVFGGGGATDKDETYVIHHIGGVVGRVGMQQSFHTDGEGTTSMTTTGAVGDKYAGSQYEYCESGSDTIENHQTHEYGRMNEGTSTLTIDLETQITAGGSSSQMVGGTPWFWDSLLLTQADEPDIREYNTNTGRWDDVEARTVPPATLGSAIGGDGLYNNNENSNPPSSTSSTTPASTLSGDWVGSTDLGENISQVQVIFHPWSAGWGRVDNAIVHNDDLVLSFTFYTHVE